MKQNMPVASPTHIDVLIDEIGDEHAAIVEALEVGNLPLARERMLAHIGHVEDALSAEVPAREDRLRQALTPVSAAHKKR